MQMKPIPNETVRRRGFTLVEILMVLAIVGITMVITMPSLVKSIRGNRLRVGARTIVMAGNYARTMSILRNQEMRLTLDKTTSTVTVEPSQIPPPPLEDRVFDAKATPPPPPPPEDGAATNEPPSALPPAKIVRQLDAVRIDSVRIDQGKSKDQEGIYTISYQGNGRCTPYEVRVVDEFGSSMLITVDAVASAKVIKEGE